MNGDFSQSNGHLSPLRIEPEDNFSGVLHQQGRVLLDSDWNEQTAITTRWQDQAGQDAIGPGVAAVPAGESDGVRIQSASVDALNRVKLVVRPGRVWADGLLTYLPGVDANPTADVSRIATYLQPPVQEPAGDVSTIKDGVRDAVVLEVWREALNGFQEPKALIEPALGGPDTTERVLTAMRFRLFRLKPGETCRNIAAKLRDDFGKRGKLKVTLQPSTTTLGDCPVEEGGGYVGVEHSLYRVEIARVNVTQKPPAFKWSQFNGGLVGRGDCDLVGTSKKITITANDQAIKMSGLSDFYLEVVEFDQDQGFWRVTYGAKATLKDDDLEVKQGEEHCKESKLPSGNVFFRLWNDIQPIANFLKAAATSQPKELRDGIRLEFDPVGASNYQPGDYWTFPLRTGEISNPPTLIDNEPPQGIHYHRVPLAILKWNAARSVSFQQRQIEDCRDIFWPLTNQRTSCCSFTVGDGVLSQGDFNSIEEAIEHLPDGLAPFEGGEICLLPGIHFANVVLEKRRSIRIKGCTGRTVIVPRELDEPLFHIVDSQDIILQDMDMIGMTAIELEDTGDQYDLRGVTIRDNRIAAYDNAIRVARAANVDIRNNNVSMANLVGVGVAIYMLAEDSAIEGNTVSSSFGEHASEGVFEGKLPDLTDPRKALEGLNSDGSSLIAYTNQVWESAAVSDLEGSFEALGGIQIAGGSERIKVLENRVRGGAGNGITLGSSFDASDLADTPDGEDSEAAKPEVYHNGKGLIGEVVAAGSAVSGIELLFVRKDDGTELTSVTEDDGSFAVGIEKEGLEGTYVVSLMSPGYKIEEVEVLSTPYFPIPLHRIRLVEDEPDPREDLAFLYEIQIERNEISAMGLSGIGIPLVVPERFEVRRSRASAYARVLAQLGNPIVDLSIHNNHIFDCLQNSFDTGLTPRAMSGGSGGIALGMCGNLSIRENRIESNGTTRNDGTTDVNPVCGVYVAYGERVDIAHNEIVDNGLVPLNRDIAPDVEPGVRGGIVMRASSLPLLDLLTKREAASGASFAVRVHDNVVEQPAGQALTITAVGPVSVVNNYFSSELSGSEDLDLWAGAVLIRNIWGTNSVATRAISVQRPAGGNTLFNGNQTLVGSNNSSITSQLILSTEDIGFDGNQSDNLQGGYLLSNTLLLGETLRASDNRLKEVGDNGQVFMSLLTITGSLNNTTNNQGDHCIIALNQDFQRPPVEAGNQVLPAGAGPCGGFRKLLLEYADVLIQYILSGLGITKAIR